MDCSRSLNAIVDRIFINFCDKNAVLTKFCDNLFLREGLKKTYLEKVGSFAKPGGGGSARVVKKQTAFLKKVFFRDYLESF